MRVILVPVADRPECAKALNTAFNLGKQIDVRDALRSCRLYKHDSAEIADSLRVHLDNHIGAEQFLLRSYMD